MDNSIYNIDTWAPSTNYFKNKILIYNNLYYYVAFDYTSSTDFNTDVNNSNLVGNIYYNGRNYPYFIWKPSYNFTNDNKPRIKSIVLGDGYEQVLPDGINTLLLKYELSFENRSLTESTAILHFLMSRNGNQSFVWLPPAPRGIFTIFKCKEWTDAMPFFSNFNIKATFSQFPV